MADKIQFTVRYKAGHESQRDWVRLTNMHCPNCGRLGYVWHEDTPGDYYVGESHLCIRCDQQWTIQGPYGVDPVNDEAMAQALAAIKGEQS